MPDTAKKIKKKSQALGIQAQFIDVPCQRKNKMRKKDGILS